MKIVPWLIAFAVCAAAVGLFLHFSSNRKPSDFSESDQDRDRSIEAAFAPSAEGTPSRDVSDNEALSSEVNEYFLQLQKAFADTDTKRLAELIWIEGMLLNAENQGLLDIPSGFQRRNFFKGANQGFEKTSRTMAQSMGFEEHRLHLIEEIKEGEVIAYVRFWHPELLTFTRLRWWLIRNPDGGWRAYDFEDLDQGFRTSTMMGVLGSGALNKAPWVDSATQLVQSVQLALSTGDFSSKNLNKNIQAVLNSSAPDALKEIAYTYEYVVHSYEGETEKALVSIDKLEALSPESPFTLYARGVCYFDLGEYEKTIEHITKYAGRLGWDADTCDYVSFSHFALDDNEKAVEFAKRGLEDLPESADCLIDLALALPAEQISQLGDYLSKTADPEDHYTTILDFCLGEGYEEQAVSVFKLLRKELPDSDLIKEYEPEFEGVDLDKAA